MRWLVALALLAVACRASWPTLPSLSDTVRNLFEDSEAERPVRPVRLMRREREEQDEEHHQQSRQTVLCSGVGQQITTENICGAGDCRATGFRCPGSSQTVAVPTSYSACAVATVSCTGSLGGASDAVLPSGCLVSAVSNCTGEQYQWSGTGCRVRQLVCPSSVVSLVSSFSCVTASLSCGGQVVTNTSVAVSPSNDPCVVTRAPCGAAETCFDWVRTCNSSTSCLWQGLPCASGCVIPNTRKNVCQCPADYSSPSCSRKRAVTCSFCLREPTAAQCERVDLTDQSAVEFDPVCHRYTTKETVSFKYRIGCRFADLPLLPAFPADIFTYAIWRPGVWAVSAAGLASVNWTAQFKVFDWLVLSDLSAAAVADGLTVAQLSGDEDVVFAVDFSRLQSSHLVGGRMYAEVGFAAATVQGINESATSTRDRVFVDFADLADLSQYPPAGAAARSAAERGEHFWQDEEGKESEGRAFFGDTTPLAVAITFGIVAVTMLVGWMVRAG